MAKITIGCMCGNTVSGEFEGEEGELKCSACGMVYIRYFDSETGEYEFDIRDGE